MIVIGGVVHIVSKIGCWGGRWCDRRDLTRDGDFQGSIFRIRSIGRIEDDLDLMCTFMSAIGRR